MPRCYPNSYSPDKANRRLRAGCKLLAAAISEVPRSRGGVVIGVAMQRVSSHLINSINAHLLENAGLACSHCLQPASSGTALQRCSKCHRISYCMYNPESDRYRRPNGTTGNARCQSKNWKEHKSLCSGLQALNNAEQLDWEVWGASGRMDRKRLFDIYVRSLLI